MDPPIGHGATVGVVRNLRIGDPSPSSDGEIHAPRSSLAHQGGRAHQTPGSGDATLFAADGSFGLGHVLPGPVARTGLDARLQRPPGWLGGPASSPGRPAPTGAKRQWRRPDPQLAPVPDRPHRHASGRRPRATRRGRSRSDPRLLRRRRTALRPGMVTTAKPRSPTAPRLSRWITSIDWSAFDVGGPGMSEGSPLGSGGSGPVGSRLRHVLLRSPTRLWAPPAHSHRLADSPHTAGRR